MVDFQLHDEFDAFKKAEIKLNHSYVPLSELLHFYCSVKASDQLFSLVTKYGKQYLELQASQIDELISWVYEMRKSLSGAEEENILAREIDQLFTGKTMLCSDIFAVL